MKCYYDSKYNVFNIIRNNHIVDQIPGTSNTMKCSVNQIKMIVFWLENSYNN